MNQSCDGSPLQVQIVQSAAKTFFARLFYAKTGEPFDLTSVTEIVALFPGVSGSPVKKTFSNSGGITIVGADGAGKIQIALSTIDTQNMQTNPQIGQNLQIIVTISGVAQINTLSFGSPPVSGTIYSVTLNGSQFSYTAKDADTAQIVLTALAAQITAAALGITPVVSGSDNTAQMSLTAQVAGLGFAIAVSAGITNTASTANAGTRTVFLLQQVLSILPQDYAGS